MKRITVYVLAALSCVAFALSAQHDKDWIVRFNKTRVITLGDYNSEFIYYARSTGMTKEQMKRYYENETLKRSFLEQLIENEIFYLAALEAGYDKKAEVTELYNDTVEDATAQYYLYSIIDIASITPTDAEKRAFFRERKSDLERMAGVSSLTYAQIESELTSIVAQEKLRAELDRIVAETKKKYSIATTKNLSAQTVATITAGTDTITISRADLDKKLEQILETGMVNEANRAQIETSQIDMMINNAVLIIKAKREGFYETEEPKSVETLVKKKIISDAYLRDEIIAKVPEPTRAEVDAAMKEYDKQYNIDQLLKSGQIKIIDIMDSVRSQLKQRQAALKKQALVQTLRDEWQIEKRIALITPPANL